MASELNTHLVAVETPPAGSEDDTRRSHQVYVELRNAILASELAPDSAISQVQLAKQLGVSRTPLREALRTLQREGLVEQLPNRRTRIAAFDPHDLDLLYGTRIALECLAIFLTVPLMEDSDLDELRVSRERMAALGVEKDPEGWEVPHRRFHQILRVHSGERLIRQAEELSDHSERYRRVYLREPRAWAGATEEHLAIERACHDRSPMLAAERLAHHLARTALTLLMEMAPQYEPRAIRGAMGFVGSAGDTTGLSQRKRREG